MLHNLNTLFFSQARKGDIIVLERSEDDSEEFLLFLVSQEGKAHEGKSVHMSGHAFRNGQKYVCGNFLIPTPGKAGVYRVSGVSDRVLCTAVVAGDSRGRLAAVSRGLRFWDGRFGVFTDEACWVCKSSKGPKHACSHCRRVFCVDAPGGGALAGPAEGWRRGRNHVRCSQAATRHGLAQFA